jgi:hypothetical protein
VWRAWWDWLTARLSRREWVFAGLVVFAYAYFFMPAGTNTLSRYDMVVAFAHGTPIIDHHASNTIDVSFYNGHHYSPRSLGLSLLAVPAYFVAHVVTELTHSTSDPTYFIAILALLTVVPAASAGVLVFARFAMRLRPALASAIFPLAAASALALGTLWYPFATSFYSHALAGALDLIGFYLLYRARSSERPSDPTRLVVWAGLLVGFADISEYPSAVIVLALGGYVLAVFPARRWRMLLVFALAMAPSALLLLGYDGWAFGNPLHISYEFVAGSQFSGQHSGLLGVTTPSLDGLRQILLWPRGLLVESPFLLLVPLGFYRWLRSHAPGERPPAEALVCLAVCILYPLLISSYFLPMAGENQPGPRLLVPMLPFACLPLIWVVDDLRRWLRALFAVTLAFGIVISCFWVALGGREYHTFLTYPLTSLFLPLLKTGSSPALNGDTPPNLLTLLHLPQVFSFYVGFLPLLAWASYLAYALLTERATPSPSDAS